jgi:lysine/ornithine N-monooxygenase
MIWSGMGKGVKKEALKNSAVFITEKLVINKGDIKKVADDIDIEDIETNFVNLNTATGAIAGKIIAKTGTKGSIKMLSKVMAASIKNKVLAKAVSKASAKLTAKITAKMSSKWIPVIGGGTSAAINIWVINSLMDAAEEYYKNDFILIQDKE